MQKKKRVLNELILYYGVLQTLHALTLARAGLLILAGEPAPFPILPPPGGWSAQAMAFLYGLAGADLIGIVLGILFAIQNTFYQHFNPRIGIVSLTVFICGAAVFAAGTFPGGAWLAHPASYLIMVILFAPAALLYFQLLGRSTPTA
ncbi:hypothetical protein KQH62_05005 [bacterium]|nr:hypothetical protein [bacterium]